MSSVRCTLTYSPLPILDILSTLSSIFHQSSWLIFQTLPLFDRLLRPGIKLVSPPAYVPERYHYPNSNLCHSYLSFYQTITNSHKVGPRLEFCGHPLFPHIYTPTHSYLSLSQEKLTQSSHIIWESTHYFRYCSFKHIFQV